MHANIAIVVIAYNRPDSLKRVLYSLSAANYKGNQDIPLIISIDHSGNDNCRRIADLFEWQQGEKSVLLHEQNLGLKKHVMLCGDMVEKFDAIVVLEDDLFVSPFFMDYVNQAYAFYKDDDRIAGIALYHNTFNEVAYCPFEPVNDGYDSYFMQVPCSWGQVWTKKQWMAFRTYANNLQDDQFDQFPDNVKKWPGHSSWKKLFYRYLLECSKYFVYPRVGLSTNFGDLGQHLTQPQSTFQTSLLLAKKEFLFQSLSSSWCLYDGFYELEGSVYNKLFGTSLSITFDLNGTKPLTTIKTKYLISSRQCSNADRKFHASCYPYENNILLNIEEIGVAGNYYSLAETTSFSEAKQFERLPVDMNRVFLTDSFIRQAVRREFEKSKEYRLGSALLKPYRRFKGFIKKRIYDHG
jgi:hypothetical protein